MNPLSVRRLAGLARQLLRSTAPQRTNTTPRTSSTLAGSDRSPYGAASARELDTTAGLPPFSYEPQNDGDADPGEVVWTWVPYEDKPDVGKDRPILVLGRLGNDVVAAQLTSQDHDRDAADEARHGRYWMDIGTGEWDSRGRPSEVRLDRLLRVGQAAVRREGGVLDHKTFCEVLAAIARQHQTR